MKRIISSVAMLVFVTAVVAGGTGAFFNDTETSAGNVFMAGAIDLTVDHARQTYNGVDCQTCGVTIYSSIATQVVDSNDVAAYQGPFPVNAQLIANPNSAWLPEASLAPAEWIWVTPIVDGADTTNDAEYTFADAFFLQGPVELDVFSLGIASDNGFKLVLNDVTIVDKLNIETTYGGLNPLTPAQQTLFENSLIQNGENTLEITVRNKADNPDPSKNPAGLIYKIEFTNEDCEAGVADFQATCELWNEIDLTDEKFFQFSDVKPQDEGTNLISLHVENNPAYLCLNVTNKEDKENTNIEPEQSDGDLSVPEGELGEHLMVMGWYSDELGNEGAPLFGPAYAEDLTTITVADSASAHAAIAAGTTEYIKLKWCLGMLDSNGQCDGDVPNINQTQTDSFLADLQFFAEQTRNNDEFLCEEPKPEV